jgi:hypothetical protein
VEFGVPPGLSLNEGFEVGAAEYIGLLRFAVLAGG